MSLATLGQLLGAGLANGAFYAFLAVSFGVILTLSRALNLAHGELVVLGGYLGYVLSRSLVVPPIVVVPVVALALVPVGLLLRALVHRVRAPVGLNSLVLTFGLSLLLQNAMLAAWSADYRLIASPVGGGPAWLVGLALGRVAAAVVGLVAILGLHAVVTWTRWGAVLRATSLDAEAAALMGINIDRVSRVSFAVASAIAGGGGVLFATFHYLHPSAGVELTLLAVTLAIFADTWRAAGRLPGLLIGGLAVGLTESVVVATAGPLWRELVVAGLLLAVLLARGPALGSRSHEARAE